MLALFVKAQGINQSQLLIFLTRPSRPRYSNTVIHILCHRRALNPGSPALTTALRELVICILRSRWIARKKETLQRHIHVFTESQIRYIPRQFKTICMSSVTQLYNMYCNTLEAKSSGINSLNMILVLSLQLHSRVSSTGNLLIP